MNISAGRVHAWKVCNHGRPIRLPARVFFRNTPRITTVVKAGADLKEGPGAVSSEEPSATPAPSTKSTADLAKEALLQTIKSEATTAKDVLGEGGLASLRQVLGEERAGALIGALDGLLANRRLATLIFAVADVALIWVIIKVARSAVTQE